MSRAFPLAGLLRVRTILQDRAAADLADAHRARNVARDRARDTAQALGDTMPPEHCDPATWQAVVAGRLSLSALLVEREQDFAAAGQVVTQRTAAWADARQDTRAVERLEERHDEAVAFEEARAEQIVLDEVAGRRHAVAAAEDPTGGRA